MENKSLKHLDRRGFVLAGGVMGLAALAGTPRTASATGTPPTAPYLNVKDYGAMGDGTTDDTTAIQNAVTAAQSQAILLFLPLGRYKITATISITASLRLVGVGRESSVLLPPTSGTAISINTTAPVQLESFGIFWTSASNGIGIACPGSGSSNIGSVFRDLCITFASIGIYATAMTNGTIDNCLVTAWSSGGILLGNSYDFDQGDSAILNCTLISSSTVFVTNSYGIQIQEGGARVECCKVIGGYFTLLFQVLNQGSGDLFIIGNSFEGDNTNTSIYLVNSSTNNTQFGGVIISGNELAGNTAIAVAPISSGKTWLTSLIIDGNWCYCGSSATTASAISINGVDTYVISNNIINTYGAASYYAIVIGSACVNGTVGVNSYKGPATAVSSASQVAYGYRMLKGTGTVTVNAAYNPPNNSLFSGSANILFPSSFTYTDLPVVMVTAHGNGANGAVSACVTGAPTTTGFTVAAFGVSNNQVITFDWVAFGN